MRVVGRWSSIFGHWGIYCAALGRIVHGFQSALREIFDEQAWDRFESRNAGKNFNDFQRDRHGRPRQRCC